MGGRIVESGGFELAERLEAEGYAQMGKAIGLSDEELADVEDARAATA
jgi:Fe-S cluster assembly ATPase SufC